VPRVQRIVAGLVVLLAATACTSSSSKGPTPMPTATSPTVQRPSCDVGYHSDDSHTVVQVTASPGLLTVRIVGTTRTFDKTVRLDDTHFYRFTTEITHVTKLRGSVKLKSGQVIRCEAHAV
jgi:hypothetical protein